MPMLAPGLSGDDAVITRRGFLGAVAVLAAAPIAGFSAREVFEPPHIVFLDGIDALDNYAGINRADFPFWRNQGHRRHDDPAFDNLRAEMRAVYNRCSRGP